MTETVLTQYLEQIAIRSQRGDIFWTQPNPSSFQWTEVSPDKNFVVTIQKAVSPKLRNLEFFEEASFLFQVLDRLNKQIVVSLSSKERPEYAKVLAEIYRGAEFGMDLRAGNILKNLLGN